MTGAQFEILVDGKPRSYRASGSSTEDGVKPSRRASAAAALLGSMNGNLLDQVLAGRIVPAVDCVGMVSPGHPARSDPG